MTRTRPDDARRDALRLAALELITIPHFDLAPTPAQVKFLLDTSTEAMYGGAAGGGKSIALLMAALQFVEVPGYRALVIRKTLAELLQPGGLLDVALQHIHGAKYSQATYTFEFPSGAKLTFGYLDHENAKLHYQGLEFHYIGFDELTHFTETQYRYLFSRLRGPSGDSPLARVPLRMRAATNPGGPGHDWVHRTFIEPWRTGGKRNRGATRFYPASLADNPHLNDTSYRANLDRLDPITRAQLRDGDWDIRPQGRMFQSAWFDIISPTELPTRLRKVRYWDLAATAKTPTNDPDYTVGALVAYDSHAKRYYIIDIQRFRHTAGKVAAHVHATAEHDGRDVSISIEEEPGSAGKTVIDHYRTTVLNGYSVRGDRPTGDKIVRAQPFASRAEHHEVSLVRGPWNNTFLDEVVLFPDSIHDDQVDATAGAINTLAQRPDYATPIIDADEFYKPNEFDIP
jgi:predicted phage terminase large subunit-like protein